MTERGLSLIGLLPALVRGLPGMLRSVTAALATVDREYADFLEGGHAAALDPAEVALQRLVWGAEQHLRSPVGDGEPGHGRPGDGLIRELFGDLGREQYRRGLPVGLLLSAYHVGARAAWRHISATAVDGGLPAECLAALAEELFSLVDQLGSVTIEAYVAEQALVSDARAQLRDALVAMLLSDRADRAAVESAARRAGWPLPSMAAVVFLRGGHDTAREAAARLGQDCLPARHTSLPGVVVPDPTGPGRRQWIVDTLCEHDAIVGPSVPLNRVSDSARIALVAARVLPPGDAGGAMFAEDHLDALIVGQDAELLEAFRTRVLRPLEEAALNSREPLLQTLRAWLVHMGNRQTMARELGVHPQTVRYRLGRLRELFGAALDDPRNRPSLMLAVAWDRPSPASGVGRPGSDAVVQASPAGRPAVAWPPLHTATDVDHEGRRPPLRLDRAVGTWPSGGGG